MEGSIDKKCDALMALLEESQYCIVFVGPDILPLPNSKPDFLKRKKFKHLDFISSNMIPTKSHMFIAELINHHLAHFVIVQVSRVVESLTRVGEIETRPPLGEGRSPPKIHLRDAWRRHARGLRKLQCPGCH